MAPELQTERLLLRPFQLEDAAQAQVLFPQWEVVKFLNPKVPWPFPEDEVYTYYRDIALPAIERGEEWHWTLRLRELPEQLIGAITLVREGRSNREFWLGLPWQRRGLMTEAVISLNDYWFEVLGFTVLRAPKAVLNVTSRRISEKTGMRVVAIEESDYVSGRFLKEVWEITAEEWDVKRAFLRAAHSSDTEAEPPSRRSAD